MNYVYAKNLHNEDEVISKKTGTSLRVVRTDVDEESRDVFIYCDDGQYYHHTEVK